MTLDIDTALTAAERTEAARQLIGRARDGELVDLAVVSALDLCVLGGPRHPLFDEDVARAWLGMGDRQRTKVVDSVTESMLGRGLLIDEGLRTSARPRSCSYALQPELGLMLAARCRPSLIVLTAAEDQDLRTVRLFALGDQAEPVRGFVVEMPAAPPPGGGGAFPDARKLGPLGWIYRYVLASPDQAADVLARWTISPPRRPGPGVPGAYLVSVYHPDRMTPAGRRLRVQGDGTAARVEAGDQGTAVYDVTGLRAVMLGLIMRRPGDRSAARSLHRSAQRPEPSTAGPVPARARGRRDRLPDRWRGLRPAMVLRHHGLAHRPHHDLVRPGVPQLADRHPGRRGSRQHRRHHLGPGPRAGRRR
jgi:hypothetical protein